MDPCRAAPTNKTLFRLAELKYKRKDQPLDLSDVLDLSNVAIKKLPEGLRTVQLNRPSFKDDEIEPGWQIAKDPIAYEHERAPGLIILPNVLPPQTQRTLIRKTLLRDIAQPYNKGNLTPFYPFIPGGLFAVATRQQQQDEEDKEDALIEPLQDHLKPMSARELLEKKLRWITLGHQYNWTSKTYPATPPPPFPTDIALLSSRLVSLLPSEPSSTTSTSWLAQTAIVNFYSPGDTLSPHTDHSEPNHTAPLLSLSLGCSAIFLMGRHTKNIEPLAILVKSGDVVVMTGEARMGFHGVPRVMEGTCPGYLGEEEVEDGVGEGEGWGEEFAGYMRGKRVNLNVRQVDIDVDEE
ncbi:hypothetical protein YB2330_002357 [Saitoella coloradoensis]